MTTEHINGLLHNVFVSLIWLLIEMQPRICLETHHTYLFAYAMADKEHNITVRLFRPVKALLLYHLRVIHKADKLPLT